MAGLLLFKLGLSNAHPIIISAIINLQPFFAALVALLVARVPIPVSPPIFFGCLVSAFLGAMAVAWSQVGEANRPELSQLAAKRDAWHLALCHSGADLLGAGRNACLQMVREIRRVGCNRGEFLCLSTPPYPRCGIFPVLAFRIGFWPDCSGRPDDRRHNRRRLGRSRALSNRAQRYRQRQWLRHDVLSPDPGPHRFDIAPLVAVDCRFAFFCQLDVLCRLVCRLGVASVFLAEILGAPARQ